MKNNFKLVEKNGFLKFEELLNFNQKISVSIRVYLWLILLCLTANAQTLAPGTPGKDAHWATAGKQAVGTSASLESKIWFTLAQGAMTEVYYPDVTTANVHLLQFVVVNTKTKKVETERDDAIHEVKAARPNSMSFQQINIAKSGAWEIQKSYTIDVERNSISISATFTPRMANLELYVYYDPSLNNSGMHDTAWTQGNAFLSSDGNKASALVCKTDSCGFGEMTNGFLGTSDGIEQLNRDGKITAQYSRAENGNVVQLAHINSKFSLNNHELFQIALGFGKTPDEALQTATSSTQKGFFQTNRNYEKGWSDYVTTLPVVEPKYQAQFNMAAMILKASEDKTVRGANVASLTVPWGGGANANEAVGGGYHLVWSRDLYQVVTAYMALGDLAAANRALDFLFNVQQKADGSFPQNSFLDGKRGWDSLQLDEVAYPLILAYQLKRFDKQTYENHVKKAADFLVKTGPKTPQERWEEKSGYSPSTIAAEIAGLVCAADIATRNGDETSANLYLKIADNWQANIEKWTATTRGKYGDGNYYLRLTENGKPDANEKTVLNNGAGTFLESEIVDAGFLELVRLGIKSADDPLIQKSVKIIDEQIKVNTPNGEGFYRYNHDGYGEMDDGRRWNWDGKYTGKGKLWALLSGERGQYELAYSGFLADKSKQENETLRDSYFSIRSRASKALADIRLENMQKFANEGLMIPEQVWDKADVPKNIDKQYVPELKFGEGTGSATPLAWSMAQFIRLAVNLQAGRNLDTPDVVYNRYVLGKKSEVISQKIAETSMKESPLKKGLSLNYILRPKNQEFESFSVNWYCDAKWVANNPSAEKIASRIGKGSNIEFFQCNPGKTTAIIFYEGAEKNVEIVGDFTGWKPKELKLMDFASKTKNLKFLPIEFSSTARVEYKLIVDGKWTIDPLNPNSIDNGVGGENSFFAMPDYKPTIWSNILNEGKNNVPNYIPRYVASVEIDSKQYGRVNVGVYAPNVTPKHSLPVLYVQDGGVYQSKARAVEIQNNLVNAGKIKPFIIVFLDPKDRMKEYWANDDYARFLATEVVPMIDAKYETIKNRDGRAILGASLGGVTSVHTALKYPEIFGRVGGQSSSFWIDNKRVVRELENLDAGKNKFKFYFDTGTLEGAEDDRKAAEILRRKGFDVSYQEAESGHNWTAWRDRLADAFIALWRN